MLPWQPTMSENMRYSPSACLTGFCPIAEFRRIPIRCFGNYCTIACRSCHDCRRHGYQPFSRFQKAGNNIFLFRMMIRKYTNSYYRALAMIKSPTLPLRLLDNFKTYKTDGLDLYDTEIYYQGAAMRPWQKGANVRG